MMFTAIAHSKDCVVLLHGLLRSAGSMGKMEARLAEKGYGVVNIDYPSRKHGVEELARIAVGAGINKCRSEPYERINFVTHSLGGILVRSYLKSHRIKELGRVVMLGPPNQGSEVVDALRDLPGFELMNGPAGMELGTKPSDIPKSLGPVDFELGVIAGTRTINLILSGFLPGIDDGKVSVKNTKVEGMSDFISMPATHPFMMKNQDVIDQTIHFLSHGKFQEKKSYGRSPASFPDPFSIP